MRAFLLACRYAYRHTGHPNMAYGLHICINVYTCMHTFMHARIHACMHTCIHAHMHTCTHTYTHVMLYFNAWGFPVSYYTIGNHTECQEMLEEPFSQAQVTTEVLVIVLVYYIGLALCYVVITLQVQTSTHVYAWT